MTRADFLLPGFVDAHLHFPQVHATSAYGGGRLPHWLDTDAVVGNFDVGKDADVVLVDVSAVPAVARRLDDGAWPEDSAEADVALLFTLLMKLSEEALTSVVVKGHEVELRPLGLWAGVHSIGRPG